MIHCVPRSLQRGLGLSNLVGLSVLGTRHLLCFGLHPGRTSPPESIWPSLGGIGGSLEEYERSMICLQGEFSA